MKLIEILDPKQRIILEELPLNWKSVDEKEEQQMFAVVNELDAEAIAPYGDGVPLMEMANLTSEDTGIVGTIYISSEEGGHGPRIRYYAGRPGKDKPTAGVEIPPDAEKSPRVFYDNIGIDSKTIALLSTWIMKNRVKLLAIWKNAAYMTRAEFDAVLNSLEKV